MAQRTSDRPGRPPTRKTQVAALCTRRSPQTGKLEVLLITSRDTGRWILPKGWPIRKLRNTEAALQEAWEEAGVRKARARRGPVGSYDYDKRLDDGETVPVRVKVYRVRVRELVDDYPEAQERNRRWLRPAKAATMVDEPGLQALLKKL